ncbi:Sodium-independent sulfate anion transporter [Trichoplax sp. H2]|uniref:STAS domain-containing protein n=1 Tax=Trichoplax adhaerens TaxID=10228 RepID=B3S8X3_TRIAD|nr:hypothetical protein TRIADDRAFT_60775 [Trichoplax adhaerens]EDV20778.1 hypothetical protein TRIADDRAFT_60775 [Trichoplax adhaerens]RDD43525.1 Sodium-independent sulfate anion transporter [Trichoplax sp. H2]|eukprot:XP_002116719.1 hypothetical protein TRIADDRAFT_60775 [Trichoplax adhaerens]
MASPRLILDGEDLPETALTATAEDQKRINRYEGNPCVNLLKEKCCSKSCIRSRLPIVEWLPKYRLRDLQCDIIAGITVGVMVVPQALAYANVAELPPQYGLYASFLGVFVYCFLGTSKDVTLGPTAVMCLMVAEYSRDGDPNYAILLAFLSGVIQVIMGFLDLGFVVNFISVPVISGFTSAAAITITVSQLKDLFGLKDIPREFFERVYTICEKLPETKPWDACMGLSCIVILYILKYMKDYDYKDEKYNYAPPKWQRGCRNFIWLIGTARNAFIAVISALVCLVLAYLGYPEDTVSLTGPIVGGLPPFGPPPFSTTENNATIGFGKMAENLNAGIIVIPLIGYLENIAIAKTFARKNKYKIDASQELIAIGFANVISSFAASLPITGSFSRSAVNSASGVRTTLAGLFTGGIVLLALAFLTNWFYYIPKAALAAIIITAVLSMIDFSIVRKLWRVKRLDLIPLAVSFFVSFVGLEYGILAGVAVSVAFLLHAAALPRIEMFADEVYVLKINGNLNYPGVERFINYIQNKIFGRKGATRKCVVIDCSHIFMIDYTTTQGFNQILEEFKRFDSKLHFAEVHPRIRRTLIAAGVDDGIIFPTVDAATNAFYDPDRELEDDNQSDFCMTFL